MNELERLQEQLAAVMGDEISKFRIVGIGSLPNHSFDMDALHRRNVNTFVSTPSRERTLTEMERNALFSHRYGTSYSFRGSSYYYGEPYIAEEKNSHQKMGKRERNKVQVPAKEKQIVNSNSFTKKKKRRK